VPYEQYLPFLIPPFSALIGWITNVIAVRMMFYPTDFKGIRPFLGWQGLVPANAKRLGQFSTRLITTKLMPLRELFDQFSPESFQGEMSGPVDQITEQVLEEIAQRAAPLWSALDEDARGHIRDMVRAEVTGTTLAVVGDIKEQITEILDLEEVVGRAIERDKAVVSQMFLHVGEKEFKFVERSGLVFGFIFGLAQMAVWLVYPAWWSLPLAGFFVGWATNWVALKLIFEPQEPRKVGPFTIQGLFHKRQKEVAKAFAELTTDRVLNTENILESIVDGPGKQRLLGIMELRLGELIDKQAENPMFAAALPPEELEHLRKEIPRRIEAELPKPGGFLHTFVDRAVNIRKELFERMTALDPKSFEGVLRPAFQQDEWKLILAGAALGLVAGVFQVVYVFGGTLAA
jgi:uncharacterized membrane protein YheB (UPF0754 family)